MTTTIIKQQMNFGNKKTLLITLFILTAMSSCLELEKFLGKIDGLCKPFIPYLKILEHPEQATEIADEMQENFFSPRQKFETNIESLNHLVSGDVLVHGLFSQEKDPGTIREIAVELVAAMINDPTCSNADALEIAIRKAFDLVVKDVTKLLNSALGVDSFTFHIDRYAEPLINSINFLILQKIWSKEIDEATAKNIKNNWNFEKKIYNQHNAVIDIRKILVESKCIYKDRENSLLRLLMYLIGSVERKPEALRNPLVKAEIEKIFDFWDQLLVRKELKQKFEIHIQSLMDSLISDVFEVKKTKDVTNGDVKNLLDFLESIAAKVLSGLADVKDIKGTMKILVSRSSEFFSSNSCTNYAKNFENALLTPTILTHEVLKFKGKTVEEQYNTLAFIGALFHSAEKDPSPALMSEILKHSKRIIDLPLNKQNQFEILMPLLCDSKIASFSKSDDFFQVALAYVAAAISQGNEDSTKQTVTSNFESILAADSGLTTGRHKIYAEFLRMITHFRHPDIITSVQLHVITNDIESQVFREEITKEEFGGLKSAFVSLLFKDDRAKLAELSQKLEALENKVDDQSLIAHEKFFEEYYKIKNANDVLLNNEEGLKLKLSEMLQNPVTIDLKALGYKFARILI